MTTAERLARTEAHIAKVTAPRTIKRGHASRGPGVGDGPLCPGEPSHGNTYLSRDRRSHYCVHQSHDLNSPARWPNDPES
jgi:hypothetical protein